MSCCIDAECLAEAVNVTAMNNWVNYTDGALDHSSPMVDPPYEAPEYVNERSARCSMLHGKCSLDCLQSKLSAS